MSRVDIMNHTLKALDSDGYKEYERPALPKRDWLKMSYIDRMDEVLDFVQNSNGTYTLVECISQAKADSSIDELLTAVAATIQKIKPSKEWFI